VRAHAGSDRFVLVPWSSQRLGCWKASAGVTAGIDMTLALVEEDLGSELALRIAKMMVVFLRRPGGQSQFSATLAAQSQDHRSLGDLLAWIADNIRQDLSIDVLRRGVSLSQRHQVSTKLRISAGSRVPRCCVASSPDGWALLPANIVSHLDAGGTRIRRERFWRLILTMSTQSRNVLFPAK
jgi:hypothetical protein